ncbi:MAG: PA2779 family protein [Nitrospiraceae bacterium]|nr:MAG: PA2779 family protein [Nitrospiraceae bacterium]
MKSLSWYLIAALFIISIVPPADAAFSPSEIVAAAGMQRETDMREIRTVLETKLVQQRLEDLGFSTEEATARLSRLSDEQLHALAQKLDSLRTGGDGLGVVIALLVIVILVVLLLQLTGKRIIIQ